MLLVLLLQLKSSSKGNGTSSASSANGDSVLVDAILFSVIVQFFNDNIGILSLSWVLDKWSISVVDKELNKVGIERRVLETICIIEGIASEATTSMDSDESWEILFALIMVSLKAKDSNLTLSVESLNSELLPNLIGNHSLECFISNFE